MNGARLGDDYLTGHKSPLAMISNVMLLNFVHFKEKNNSRPVSMSLQTHSHVPSD